MANKLSLTLACGDYEITRPLKEGTVQPEGIALTVLNMAAPERHWRMSRFVEFDVAELSMSEYLAAGSGERPYTAIPVFPHRRFRHAYVFINVHKGITKPSDLNGRRVGLRNYQVTAGLWLRGILAEHYGVDLKSIHWFCQDPEDVDMESPPWLQIELVPPSQHVDTMLVSGELDAVIYPDTLPSILKGLPQVRRLFVDYKQEEIAYYTKTGIFPIMHTVVIKNQVLEKNPWVGISLWEAFEEAKRLAYRRLENLRALPLAWLADLHEEQKALLGPDPWPYTTAANRLPLETMIRYAHEQGLIPRPYAIEELFHPSTLQEVPRLGF